MVKRTLTAILHKEENMYVKLVHFREVNRSK